MVVNTVFSCVPHVTSFSGNLHQGKVNLLTQVLSHNCIVSLIMTLASQDDQKCMKSFGVPSFCRSPRTFTFTTVDGLSPLLERAVIPPRNRLCKDIMRGAQNRNWPLDGLTLSHARVHPVSKSVLLRAISRAFARAPGRVGYWVSRVFPCTNCMNVPPRGARPKL
jgi:hypothetical protein